MRAVPVRGSAGRCRQVALARRAGCGGAGRGAGPSAGPGRAAPHRGRRLRPAKGLSGPAAPKGLAAEGGACTVHSGGHRVEGRKGGEEEACGMLAPSPPALRSPWQVPGAPACSLAAPACSTPSSLTEDRLLLVLTVPSSSCQGSDH